ncbi:MAG: NAD(P)-dependent oxidoreductase [Pseudomonadota bacterium]|nr:NAD(P)-dependent oxidoreductase [Pseudomonadota bacterium]
MAVKIKTVGVVGLGKMGGPLARHLATGGFDVVGYDIAEDAVTALADAGVIATNCADLAAQSDLAIIGVGFDSEVEEVIFGETGLLSGAKSGMVLAVASTIAPSTMISIAERAGPGVICLDIPMCRGEQAALDGDLLLLGGGNKEAFDACTAVFQTFANEIYYLGDLGAGQTGKMVNNLILWSCISANHEGMALANALGVDTDALRGALLNSSAHNWAMEVRAETWELPWAEKDMSIVLKEADNARISLPLCGSVKEVIKGIKINLGQGMPRER